MGRTVMRIYHPWWNWECYKAGFYSTVAPGGRTPDEARDAYRVFLADIPRFNTAMLQVADGWKNSCEHFLTNPAINRVAWLGQSAMCIATGVPSIFRGGFKLLTVEQQRAANNAAQMQLESWMSKR